MLPARITRIQAHPDCPDIRRLWLAVDDDAFTHKPGQWLDLRCPGVERLGGFSIVSPPTADGSIELCVKFSPTSPAAAWLVRDALVGDVVDVAVGGTVFWDAAVDGDDLLLVAGGMGLNPLFSIAQAAVAAGRRVHLLCASKRDQVLFSDEIDALVASSDGAFTVQRLVDRRVTVDDVRPLGDRLVFVCGPPGFADAVTAFADALGVPADRVRCERWW